MGTDEFPSDPRKAMLSMMIILNQGGNNFDCKLRRESTDLQDMFIAHAGGMDCLARGLRGAVKLIEDGVFDKLKQERYSTWDTEELAKKVIAGKATLEEVAAYAKTKG